MGDFEDLFELNQILLRLLGACQKSVGSYMFAQILQSAHLTQYEYQQLIDFFERPQSLTYHINLN